jgi:hypothetical protein
VIEPRRWHICKTPDLPLAHHSTRVGVSHSLHDPFMVVFPALPQSQGHPDDWSDSDKVAMPPPASLDSSQSVPSGNGKFIAISETSPPLLDSGFRTALPVPGQVSDVPCIPFWPVLAPGDSQPRVLVSPIGPRGVVPELVRRRSRGSSGCRWSGCDRSDGPGRRIVVAPGAALDGGGGQS